MKKKILVTIAAGLIFVSAIGCGTTYQETINTSAKNSFGNGYFTELAKWNDGILTFKIVYDNGTKVKYFIMNGGRTSGITPLYNADGTLQIYDGE